MLRLLTDEHISPTVAEEISKRCRGSNVLSIHDWYEGHFLGQSDEFIMVEASHAKLTLVTFDLRTIPNLLRRWAEQGVDHSGAILVDERTIAHDNIGKLIASLSALWKAQRDLDWCNRVIYLSTSK